MRRRGERVNAGAQDYDYEADRLERDADERFTASKQALLDEAKASGSHPDPVAMLAGDETFYIATDGHTGQHGESSFRGSTYESDEDMLDGFGSDWEEDVPATNWFARAERASRTGVQLEELYFQESLMDIKGRVDAFEAAHDDKFPLPVRTHTHPCQAPTRARHPPVPGTRPALPCPALSCLAQCFGGHALTFYVYPCPCVRVLCVSARACICVCGWVGVCVDRI